MKTKKVVLNLIAAVGMVLLILPMFLAMYGYMVVVNNSSTDPQPLYIFNDWSGQETAYQLVGKTFLSAFAVITDILAVVLLCLAAIYVVLFVLQLLKVGKVNTLDKIKKLLALLAILCTIASVITFAVFMFGNTTTVDMGILGTTKYTFVPQVGTIMMVVGGLVFGVFGMLASKKK